MVAGLIGAGLSAIGGITNAVAGARAYKNGVRILNDAHDKAQNYYTGLLAQDYTNRSDVRAVLTKQKQLLSDEYKRARARNIVAGGTDESLSLMQGDANNTLADTMGSIASQAATYKDTITQQKMQNEQAFANQQAQLEQKKADNIAQAASTSVNVGGKMMANDDWSWLLSKRG